MPENAPTREMVESTVGAVFEAQSARMQAEVIRLVWEQLNARGPALGSASATAQLLQAATNIEQSGAQSDILQALLEGTTPFAARTAVFLVRAASAMGWQARGFKDNEAVKLLNVDTGSGLAQQALVRRTSVCGKAAEFDARFAAESVQPFDPGCVLIPLSVRDKVVAVVYADAGTEPGGALDQHAIELLTRLAGIWLELLALRKSTGIGAPNGYPVVSQPPAVSASVPEAAADAVPSAEPVAAPPTPAVEPAASTASPSTPSEDEELHRKARRFARLLVEEIKLYNLPKVRDGKLHRNLYDRLKDDIEKSRATYDQRYAKTPIASAEYFTQELVRGLADGDATLFGSNFPR